MENQADLGFRVTYYASVSYSFELDRALRWRAVVRESDRAYTPAVDPLEKLRCSSTSSEQMRRGSVVPLSALGHGLGHPIAVSGSVLGRILDPVSSHSQPAIG